MSSARRLASFSILILCLLNSGPSLACRGIVANFPHLDLDGAEARKVFRQIWNTPWARYIDVRDQYWKEASIADSRGDSGTVFLRLNDIIALKRVMWAHYGRNVSATGALRTSYRYFRNLSKGFTSMSVAERELFWLDRESLASVPSGQLRDVVLQALKVAEPSLRWRICLVNFLIEMQESSYPPLRTEGERLSSPSHPHPPEITALLETWNI